MERNHVVGIASTLAVLLAGCATTVGARPDDMSAAAHRREGAAHDAEGSEHAEQYDESASRPSGGTPATRSTYSVDTYNPTATHAGQAAAHRREAADHRAAAAALERFEEEECASFPAETRAACPLFAVARVEEIDGGARIHFAPGVNRDAVLAHMRCHIAYARVRGREGMDECPMYLEGVTADAGEDSSIEVRVGEPGVVNALRARIASHVLATDR